MFKKINEQIEKFLEGEVVDFASYRNKKNGVVTEPRQRRTLSQEQIDALTAEVFADLDKEDKTDLYKEEPKEEGNELPAKNYKKEPAKAEVGDILVCEWGYSMRLVDYYRVISANGKSVKLEHLKGKRITDDGWTGTEVPTDKVEKDDRVDGKSFRIIPPERQFMHDIENWNVCKINGNYAEFWDGKPKHFDTLD